MSAGLPPLPDLIPIAALKKLPTSVGNNNNNNNKVSEECVQCGGGDSDSGEVMGEQRSRRIHRPPEQQIDSGAGIRGSRGNSGGRKSEGSPPPPPPPAPTRHRKSERRRRDRKKRSPSEPSAQSTGSSSTEEVQPRVNPIFVWVRQQDTHIVEVKCEDYDKRNRILLTKTAQGWRAIPRTNTTTSLHHHRSTKPDDASEVRARHKKSKRHHRVKRRSTGVQVEQDLQHDEEEADAEDVDVCPASPSPAPPPERSLDDAVAEEQCRNKQSCDVSPLDNLLAVAELEFHQQQWSQNEKTDSESFKPDEETLENLEQLDIFMEACENNDEQSEITDANKDETGECDYTEEEENNIAMDDILTRLEQSLRSPDTMQSELSEIIKNVPLQELKIEEQPTDLSRPKNHNDLLVPTDLSVPKTGQKRPLSPNSETIQSPQPSGIPAVPHSPDNFHAKNKYLESLLSPTIAKEPLNLEKPRETGSPKVTCSEEVEIIEPPPQKKIKLEDITLKTLLDNDANTKETKQETDSSIEPSSDPVAQLKQLLSDNNINIPDPMLIPKNKLSQILSNPGKEIPKLLSRRPELRLPEALAFPHLLQNPDILVITLEQLQTIVQKQNQSLPVVQKEESEKKKKEEVVIDVPDSPPPKSSPKPDKTKSSNKIGELSSDIDAATNAAFTQMMWLPYLNQLESAAMNSDFLKLLTTMFPGYPGPLSEMSHMMGANRLPPFTPPAFAMPSQMNYNPLELSMWQEAMLMARTKNQYELLSTMGKSNPFQFGAAARPKLQMPQFNPLKSHQSSSSKNKISSTSKNPYDPSSFLQRSPNYPQQHSARSSQPKQPKVQCRPFVNLADRKYGSGNGGRVPGPIDLSGSAASSSSSSAAAAVAAAVPSSSVSTSASGGGKLKVKHNLVDSSAAPRLLKEPDVAEVGSTTASIEEMQDAQKHLWHPLFGNQKSYSSPWNWTTVTATGE